jgi:hypothetical protein
MRLVVLLAWATAVAVFVAQLARVPAHAADATEHINIAGRDVAVWKPAGPAPERGDRRLQHGVF